VRYVGITTSEGRRHGESRRSCARIRSTSCSVSYNVLDREAENRILPLAREPRHRGDHQPAVPRGDLVRTIMRKPLPPCAAEIGARSWAQLILKFIISHPAVTCVIPATTRVDHVQENSARRAIRCPMRNARAHRARSRKAVAAMSNGGPTRSPAFCCSRRAPITGCSSCTNAESGRCRSWHLRPDSRSSADLAPPRWSGRAVATILVAVLAVRRLGLPAERYDDINFAARYFADRLCAAGAAAGRRWSRTRCALIVRTSPPRSGLALVIVSRSRSIR
jgi:hypothetical protein